MNIADITGQEPTLSVNNSRLCYLNIIMEQTTWRCYTPLRMTGGTIEIDKLIGRYLRSHATAPSLFGNTALATEPLEIFACPWGQYTLHGGLFANGSVVHVRNADSLYNLLFVEETTAEVWGYPQEYRIVASSAESEPH